MAFAAEVNLRNHAGPTRILVLSEPNMLEFSHEIPFKSLKGQKRRNRQGSRFMCSIHVTCDLKSQSHPGRPDTPRNCARQAWCWQLDPTLMGNDLPTCGLAASIISVANRSRNQKSMQTFSGQCFFFENPSGHGRPHRRLWTSAPTSVFSCSPRDGEN